jgi:hypothetical protein
MGEVAPPLSERHSCHLDKKNKDCDIPVAKRVEYRRAEAFGEVPKIKSWGKASEEVLDEKMQHYLQMYKKQHTPQGIEAVRALVKANAWSLLLRGCTAVHCLRREFVCVCGVCLCWIQGVSFILRSRGSCFRHRWCAMSWCVGSMAGFPELTVRCMVFGSDFPY